MGKNITVTNEALMQEYNRIKEFTSSPEAFSIELARLILILIETSLNETQFYESKLAESMVILDKVLNKKNNPLPTIEEKKSYSDDSSETLNITIEEEVEGVKKRLSKYFNAHIEITKGHEQGNNNKKRL